VGGGALRTGRRNIGWRLYVCMYMYICMYIYIYIYMCVGGGGRCAPEVETLDSGRLRSIPTREARAAMKSAKRTNSERSGLTQRRVPGGVASPSYYIFICMYMKKCRHTYIYVRVYVCMYIC